jgi:tetratricopeptide (TPR) repeat protein
MPHEARYLAHAEACRKNGEFADAATCYSRLLQSDESRPDYRYGAALVAEATGELDRAVLLMSELAPDDRAGHGAAHLWMARWLSKQPSAGPDSGRRIERHLVRALAKQADLVDAHALLAERYMKEQKYALAEPHLLKAIADHPELRFKLAVAYRAMGLHRQADAQVLVAFEHFSEEARAKPDDPVAPLRWAEAAMLLGKFPEAVAILQHGLELHRTHVYREALGDLFGVWSDTLTDSALTKFGNRLALIEQGLRYEPGNPGLLQRLLALTRPTRREFVAARIVSTLGFADSPLDSGPMTSALPVFLMYTRSTDPAAARAVLHNLLVKGEAPAVVHLALANDAWEQGKVQEARMHLEHAYRLAPEMVLVCNNLAWVLAHYEPLDFPRALQLANALVERFPENTEFRSTRGHILTRMKRWQEAIPDLELALKVHPDQRDLHRALAEAYGQLGMSKLSALHQQRAVRAN